MLIDDEILPPVSILTGKIKKSPGRPKRGVEIPAEEKSIKGLTKFKPIHLHALEVLLADPTMTNRELAAQLGRSEFMVAQLVGSDIFKAALRESLDERKQNIQNSIMDKIQAVQDKTLKKMYDLVERSFDLKDVTRAAEVALRMGGYGPKKVEVNNNNAPTIHNAMVVNLPSEVFERANRKFGKPVVLDQEKD